MDVMIHKQMTKFVFHNFSTIWIALDFLSAFIINKIEPHLLLLKITRKRIQAIKM